MHTQRVSRVTIYSQQVRALRLVHALDQVNEPSPLAERQVVVIGGGICGATAAAAAALCGARVTLFEQGEELLHFQRGCHTRYLHPGIFDWPLQPPSLRASAQLPIMNWSVGTAHEVAEQLVGQFFWIQAALRKPGRKGSLEARTRTIAHVLTDRIVHWKNLDTGDAGRISEPAAIIFATGFGVEQTLPGVLPRSYWRVDSLSQTALEAAVSKYRVVVVGAGDGGLLDAIRAKVKNFDHGSFIDGCVQALEGARQEIAAAEEQARTFLRSQKTARKASPETEKECSAHLESRYGSLPEQVWEPLDEAIGEFRPGTHVTWITQGAPWRLGSQPLHRVLLWRLVRRHKVEHVQGNVAGIETTEPRTPSDVRYRIRLNDDSREIAAHEVVLRVGAKPAQEDVNRGIGERLAELPAEEGFEELTGDTRSYFDRRAAELGVRPRSGAHRRKIAVRAAIRQASDPEVFTVELWLEGCPEQIQWVEYDLHPEYGVITRRATWVSKKRPFRHWLHSQDDYWIRVRLSDGFEVGTWLSKAIDQTPGQPDGYEKWLDKMKGAAKDIRNNGDYDSREWTDLIDVEPYLDSKQAKPLG